jgi:hypothetical protein
MRCEDEFRGGWYPKGSTGLNIRAWSIAPVPLSRCTLEYQHQLGRGHPHRRRRGSRPDPQDHPAERAARDILDGVEKNAYRVLIGRDARLMDALYRLTPRRSARLIASRMKDLLRT